MAVRAYNVIGRLQSTEQVSYSGGTACSLGSFDAKLAGLNHNCCNTTDKDDKCKNSVPIHCDYECAKFLPSFYPSCKHIISVMMGAGAHSKPELVNFLF